MSAVPSAVHDLVDRFDRNRDSYKNPAYNETQVRREFIDPLFKALGWDVWNQQGYAEAYKDVIHEDAIKVGGVTKAPDYCFRIGGTRKFFLEAKRPAVGIKDDPAPAYQLRRYAWSAKLPLSILTDFEEFAAYDCRLRPHKTDKSSKGRTLYFTYDEYVDRWEDIAAVFSRDAVLKGSFDKYAESTKRKRGTAEVDDAFLAEIEQWRDMLARNLALRNPDLTQRDLNFAVQRTIDRIVFLRICEDRGIEPYGTLQALTNGDKVYQRLFERFRRADERYNSGLFHFTRERGRPEEPDDLTPGLTIDDKSLKDILARLYYPESPYEFSVLPADILGQVYEQFLGKVIRLTKGHRAVVEEKPEVRKAGGVYYTPTYIVDYIVKHTVGKLVEGKTPQQVGGLTKSYQPSKAKGVRPLTVLDPACGSGSFLLGAYQFLLDWYRDRYLDQITGGPAVADQIHGGAGVQGGAGVPPADTPQAPGSARVQGSAGVSPADTPLAPGRAGVSPAETPQAPGSAGVQGGAGVSPADTPQAPGSAGVSPAKPPTIPPQLQHCLYQGAGAQWRLTTAERKRILLAHIHGVDIDSQAVETTKLSLLLKVLEGESAETIGSSLRLFHERALPDLAGNIKCGNSLIGPDFYDNQQLAMFDEEERLRINVFDWHAEFKEIMRAGGFDAVIGNPPYDVLEKDRRQSSWPHTALTSYVAGKPHYADALGGKTNLFRFFVVRSIGLVRSRGKFGMIMPLAILADVSCARTRRFVISKTTALAADCFPQKDNPTRRVFRNAKLSTTVLTGTVNTPGDEAVYVRTYPWNSFEDAHRECLVRLSDVAMIDPQHTPIPLVDGKTWAVCRRLYIHPRVVRLDVCAKISRGEINQTIYRRFIHSDSRLARMIKGVEIGRYRMPERLSQGKREWFDEAAFLREHSVRPLVQCRRIATQRITGVDERLRVVANVVEAPAYFADSTNSVVLSGASEYDLLYVLGLLNSRLYQWRFKLTSTNNNVGTNELAAMPFRAINFSDSAQKRAHDRMVSFVQTMLDLHKQLSAAKTPPDRTAIQRQIDATDRRIDMLVYELYDLTDDEIRVVEDALRD